MRKRLFHIRVCIQYAQRICMYTNSEPICPWQVAVFPYESKQTKATEENKQETHLDLISKGRKQMDSPSLASVAGQTKVQTQ